MADSFADAADMAEGDIVLPVAITHPDYWDYTGQLASSLAVAHLDAWNVEGAEGSPESAIRGMLTDVFEAIIEQTEAGSMVVLDLLERHLMVLRRRLMSGDFGPGAVPP